MDFHSLLRRDLQFLCKRNKIPANLTNVAMADALSALEIVEGLDEYMNQSNSKVPQTPSSVARQVPSTSTRTTRRKATMTAEPQSSSVLVSRSGRSSTKNLAGEMDQENINKNVALNVAEESKTNNVNFEGNVPKTPAARSTRKVSAATSRGCKVQEKKKDELVQSVYSTRRSTRLLEKTMADLSLKTRENLDKPAKNEETEQKVSTEENNPAGLEAGAFHGRDLNLSMEQVCENLKNDNDQVVGDIDVMDPHNVTNKETRSETEVSQGGDVKLSVEKVSENLKNDSDQVVGDIDVYVEFGDVGVMDADNETNKEKMNSEIEVSQGGDLNVSVEQVSENLKNASDQVVGDIDVFVDLGDTDAMDVHNETNKEKINSETEVFQGRDLKVSVEPVSENLKNDNDQVVGDLDVYVDLAVMDVHNETNKEKMNSETEVFQGGDLNVSVEQVSENLKNDSDQVVGDLELYDDLGDIAVIDVNNETHKEKMNEVMSDDKDSENSLVRDDKQEETIHAICEEVPEKNDNDLEVYDIPVLEHSNAETNIDDNESKDVLAFDSLVKVDQQGAKQVTRDNESDTEDINKDEDSKTQENESDQQEKELITQENESDTEEINKSDENSKTQVNVSDQQETEQVTQENESDTEEINKSDEDSKTQVNVSDQQETEQVTQENESETDEINKSNEDSKTNTDAGDSEPEPEEYNSGVDSDGTISEADSTQAVLGSDISETEDLAAVQNSPPVIEEAKLSKTTPLSPPVIAESISFQFPRPSKSTTPLKNSGMKMVYENKENNMEMMMNNENGESKGEEVKTKKMKVEIDEENLKDASMRQLVKMVKELTIKNSNRTALQILPGNNQTTE